MTGARQPLKSASQCDPERRPGNTIAGGRTQAGGLSDAQFDRLRSLALSLAGIRLVKRHRDLLERRMTRCGIVDSSTVDRLLSRACQGDTHATQQILSWLTTKYTHFFRNPAQIEVAARHVRHAALKRARVVRLWSAGTATGEECYSLAMALIEIFQCLEPPAEILATDIDTDALNFARAGVYAQRALKGMEPGRRARFFQSSGEDRWLMDAAVRAMVDLERVNLVADTWSVRGPFEVILCRNVLMYLEPEHRHNTLKRMAALLEPEGLLVLDPTEHLGTASALFRAQGIPGVYSPQRVFDENPAPLLYGRSERKT